MRNLLLEQDKKKIRREYFLRIAFVSLVFVFFSVIFGNVFLLPSYFLSNTKKRALEEQRTIIEQSIAVHEQDASIAVLVEADDKLSLLAPSKGSSLFALIEQVVHALPPGVSVEEFVYGTYAERDNELHLSGVADTREDLRAFQNALRGKPLFTSVVLPVSNLAADKNISFSLTLTGSF